MTTWLIAGVLALLYFLCKSLVEGTIFFETYYYYYFRFLFYRLTNSGPFIEDENEEVRTRIIKRTIDWKTLENKAVSEDGTAHFLALNPLLTGV